MDKIIVIPLGTVSPYPKDDKNCPGFLIKYNNYNILLDCGNGCTRLLNLPNDLNNLNIFISHLHPDHYGDLLSLIQATLVYSRYSLIKNPINLYIPNNVENILDYKLLEQLASNTLINIKAYNNINLNIGNIKITSLLVPHQISSYAFKIETQAGSIVYSSDTGTKNNLKEFALNTDLFICESTFLKNQKRTEDAHLYTYEAAKIAADANVKQLLLTHFWPEIDKQKYVEEAREIFNNVSAAKEGKALVIRR